MSVGAPVLLELDHSSLRVGWIGCPPSTVFEIALRAGDDGDWISLSDSWTTTSVRKKNLSPATLYYFKVRGKSENGEWTEWSPASESMEVLPETTKQVDAPVITGADGISLYMLWDAVSGASGYQLRFRKGEEIYCMLKISSSHTSHHRT